MTTVAREPIGPRAAHPSVAQRLAATNEASGRFFTANAELIARACHAMAMRFQGGGRLLVYGQGAQRSDVAHAVVEFVHPVIVGKRALPAMAVDAAPMLDTLGRSGDILMVLKGGELDADDAALIAQAHSRGILTIALTGHGRSGSSLAPAADFVLAVPSGDHCVVQETHETTYHMLWELVHVFFEHRAVSP